MRNRVQGCIAGLFVLLFCLTLTGLTSAADAATTATGGQACVQGLLPAQVKALAKTVAATTTGQGKISGRVTDKSTGAGIEGVDVTAMASNVCSANYGSATTDANGYYTIDSLVGGSYYVEFSPPVAPPYYFSQWYNGVLDMNQGTTVQVTEPNTTPNINAVLERGGSISGTVSASGNLFGVTVTATGSKGGSGSTSLGFEGTGAYTINGLATDTYTVTFSSSPIAVPIPDVIQYATKELSGIAVTAPDNTPNINITLEPGGSITGKVTDDQGLPIAQLVVFAQQSSSATPSMGFTDASGVFTIGGLNTGTYEITFFGRTKGYLQVKKAGVAVTAPNSTDIGATRLQVGGHIKGTVKNPSGAPLQNVYVSAYKDTEFVNGTMTAADGTYDINALETGTYKVQFFACQGNYVEQWYNNKPTRESADPVNVVAPNTVTSIDAVLNLEGANVPPVANSQSVTTEQNSARAITLVATDTPGDTLTYSIVDPPGHGTLSGTAPNLTYTPATGYTGSDSFTFKANDGKADSNVATVSITVTAGAPVTKGDVNGDNQVDVFDALLTLQNAVGLYKPTDPPAFVAAADVFPLENGYPKGDDKVDVFDALATLRHAVGLDPWPVVLTPPANLVAVAGNGQVNLTWGSSTGATSYNLYYATAAGVTKTNSTKITGVTSPYEVKPLNNGTTYYFVVTAATIDSESDVSPEASATPAAPLLPPAAPTGVTVTPGDGKATVSWNASSGATSYNLYYAVEPGVTKTNSTKIAGVTSSTYVVTPLDNDTPYYFVVTAVNAQGESGVSQEVSATPQQEDVGPLLIGTWDLDAKNSSIPTLPEGINKNNATGTLVIKDDDTFVGDLYYSFFPGLPSSLVCKASGTYSVSGNSFTITVESTEGPYALYGNVGTVTVESVTFSNNNTTVTFEDGKGNRLVFNRR